MGQLCCYNNFNTKKEHEHLVPYGHGKLKFNISTYTNMLQRNKDDKAFKHKNVLG